MSIGTGIRSSCIAGLLAIVLLLIGAASSLAAPPANDDFTAAQTITGSSGEITASTFDATAETATATDPDVWYVWTAPQHGALYVRIEGVGGFAGVEIGDAASLLTFGDISTAISCDVMEVAVATNCRRVAVTAGVTYRIRVFAATTSGVGSGFVLGWSSSPANDERAQAAPLSGLTGSVGGTTSLATNDAGGFAQRDVWYAWTPSTNIELLFQLHAPGAALTSLQVTAAAVATPNFFGVVVNCADFGVDPADRTCLRVPVLSGETLHLRVVADLYDPPVPTGLPFTLAWAPVAPVPANDLFSNAQALTGSSGAVSGSTISAGGEIPAPNPNLRDVWYRWQPPSDGPVLFTFQAPTASFHGFEMGTGSNPESLAPAGETTTCGWFGPFPSASSVCYRLEGLAGATYYLRAIAMITPPTATSLGTSFEIMWRPLPPNDRFADALPLTGGAGSIAGTTVDATGEAGGPDVRDVWYTFTAANLLPMLFDLSFPSGAFHGFAVGHPPDIHGFVSDGTVIDCATVGLDAANRTCILVNPTAGALYHVRVLVHLPTTCCLIADGGPFTLSWRPQALTFDGLCELTMTYADQPGVGHSLCAKLAAAERVTGRARANIIQAYINEVEAQTGGALTEAEAATLIAAAREL